MQLLQSILVIPLVLNSLVTPNVDIDYQGAVDIYTGAPVSEEEGTTVQTVRLSDGSYYDRESHTFHYTVLGQEEEVISSVAGGMITTDAVSLTIPENLGVKLYRDGAVVSEADFSAIQTPGEYSLVVVGTDSETLLLTFTIVSAKTGKLTTYMLPDGFMLQSVSIDGTMQATNYTGSIDFSKEGSYEVSYRCLATGISYTLRVIIDHTPPEISFEGVTNGVARGPVQLNGVEETDTVTVLFNDTEVKYPNTGLFRSVGKYRVTVTDDAGNATTENFKIQLYLNIQGVFFVLLAIGLIIGVVVYMYVSRKKLRVR